MKCPWADGECQDEKYIESCKAQAVNDIKYQLSQYKQTEHEAAEVVSHNMHVLASYCWRLKK